MTGAVAGRSCRRPATAPPTAKGSAVPFYPLVEREPLQVMPREKEVLYCRNCGGCQTPSTGHRLGMRSGQRIRLACTSPGCPCKMFVWAGPRQ